MPLRLVTDGDGLTEELMPGVPVHVRVVHPGDEHRRSRPSVAFVLFVFSLGWIFGEVLRGILS